MAQHVTILYPFVPAEALDASVISELREVADGTPSFGLLLAENSSVPGDVKGSVELVRSTSLEPAR